jgi:nitrite reductase/ring-hydroxylating ferredoxin subunit
MLQERPPAAEARNALHADRPSRRRVLTRILVFAAAVPFVGSLVAMLRRVQAGSAPLTVAIPPDVSVGLSVIDALIVDRSNDGTIRAFVARCTHLGCQIDRIEGNQAVCPCHGSRYRADGTVLVGPATRPLRPCRIETDPVSGGWIAHAS